MEELIASILLSEEYKIKCFNHKFIQNFIIYLKKNHPEIYISPLNPSYTTILRNISKNAFPYIGILNNTFYIFYNGTSISRFVPKTLIQKQFEKLI